MGDRRSISTLARASRILARRALDGQHPETARQVMDWLARRCAAGMPILLPSSGAASGTLGASAPTPVVIPSAVLPASLAALSDAAPCPGLVTLWPWSCQLTHRALNIVTMSNATGTDEGSHQHSCIIR
jgi:hypothetical protein